MRRKLAWLKSKTFESGVLPASDRKLLSLRLCDIDFLKNGVDGSPLRRFVHDLHSELSRAGFQHFRPRVYFGDEWFSPEGLPLIAVPFYLAHPRLATLEQQMMRTLEGGSPAWFRKLLRHEAGHCFDHAYEVSGTRKWRQIFGDPQQPYRPDVYLPDRGSTDYVINLEGHYAQSHPDEDFAETFAVLINPSVNWENRYRNWPGALRKLEYVWELIQRHGPRHPRVGDGPDCYNAARMRMTLARYYAKRKSAQAQARRAVKNMALRSNLQLCSPKR